MTWLDSEPRLVSVAIQQVQRMVARARSQPFIALGLAFVLAALFFGAQALRPVMYDSEVGLLITEGAFAADGRPRPRGELRSFVLRTILRPGNLEGLISKHDLVRKLGESSLESTIDRVRKLIEVSTWHDDFEGYRQRLDPPRSARVTIGFSAPDPALALAVSSHLGALVAETQIARESETAAVRVDRLRLITDSAAVRAAGLHNQLDHAQQESLQQPGGISKVRAEQLSRATKAAEAAWKSSAEDLVNARLHAHAARDLGSLVQIVDRGVPYWNAISRHQRLARQAVLSLALAGFLAVILVGAFDPKVQDEQDVRRTGLRPLGRVPACSNASSRTEV